MDRSQSHTHRSLSTTGRLISWSFRSLMKLVLIVLFIAIGLTVGGFLKFSSTVTEYEPPTGIEAADGVVVLTGGSTRIATSLDIMARNKGKRLLISGVNKKTRLRDLRAYNTGYDRIFNCCVDVERLALDTIGNAVETRKWMEKHGYKSLLLVTSNYHMPRSLLEFQRHMQGFEIISYPVIARDLDSKDWWKNPTILRLMISEYLKYVGAWSRDFLKPNVINALQATVAGG